jgi:mRNA interferase MazF
VISNDEYNTRRGTGEVGAHRRPQRPHPTVLVSASVRPTRSPGAFVSIYSVVQILDRTALRDNHGFVSHDTMNVIEEVLREFLELPDLDRTPQNEPYPRWC